MKTSNSSMKRLITAACGILVLMFMSQSALAQEQSPTRNWSIDLLGGVPVTQFTTNSKVLTPAAAFNIRYAANPRFGIRGSFAGGMFEDEGTYESQYLRFSLQPEYTLTPYENVKFVMFGGVGVNTYSVTGTGSRYNDFEGFTPNFSFGSEFRVHLSPRLDFMLQAEQNYTTTSEIDGIIETVVDRNDKFLTAMAGLTVKFGSSQSRHAMWDTGPSVEEEVRPLARKIENLERKTEKARKRVEQQEEKVEQTRRKIEANTEEIEELSERNVMEQLDSVQARLDKLSKEAEKEEKMRRSTGNYYIIGGSFMTMDRAMKFLRELKSQGHDQARILPPKGDQERGHYRVAFTSGMSFSKANSLLESKYKSIISDAWLVEYQHDPVLEEQ